MPEHYRLHGVHIRTVSDHPAVKRGLRRALRYKGAEPISSPASVEATLDFRVDRDPTSFSDDAQHLGESEHCGIGIWKMSNRMVLRREKTTVDLRPDTGIAEGAIAAPTLPTQHRDRRRNPFFYLVAFSLTILLRHRDWFPLHAAGLARDERGVLLAAQSGSGKTTAALSLVRNGWKYLSDDTVLLRSGNNFVRAYSYRQNFCVDPAVAAHFPELKRRDWPSSLSDSTKWQVDVDELYPERSAVRCTPRLVVLPDIVDTTESHVEAVDPKPVLGALVSQGAFFLTSEVEVASRHLEVLKRLLDQSRTVRLHAGRDVLDDPRVIHDLLGPLLEDVSASGTV